MKHYDEYIDLSLILKSFDEELSSDERDKLNEWLNRDAHYRRYYDDMRKNYEQGILREVDDAEIAQGWRNLKRRLYGRERRIGRRLFYYAAAVVVVLLGGTAFFMLHAPKQVPVEVAQSVEPFHKQVVLELSNEDKYVLNGAERGGQIRENIVLDSGRLEYRKVEESEKTAQREPRRNRLTVPEGCEYQLALEDGTQVWLNAQSAIVYPEFFKGDKREVYVEGEVYFDVAKDAARPFIVRTANQRVEVLGTEFCIACYKDEAQEMTTLVSGTVKVQQRKSSSASVLKPGMQWSYDKESGVEVCRYVDVEEFVAWREGKYIFNKKRLEDIMITLARWYDFDVFYVNQDAKEIVFSADMPRFVDFNDILELLQEAGDVTIQVKGKVLYVYKK